MANIDALETGWMLLSARTDNNHNLDMLDILDKHT